MTFREVLVRNGARFHAHATDPNEIFLCCPYCVDRGETPDGRFRLGVNVASGAGHCFNCGWKHRHAVAALLRTLRVDPASVLLEPQQRRTEAKIAEPLPDDFQVLSKVHSDLDRLARRYLKRRGISQEQIHEKKIGVSFIGRYAYRVIFPIWKGVGISNGFVARDFTNCQEPRYLTSLGDKSLYNYRVSGSLAVLSEGVFKALRIEHIVPTEVVSMAVLGRSITPGQIGQLEAAKFKRVLLWPDPDFAGRQGCVSIADQLSEAGFSVSVIWPIQRPADEESTEVMLDSWRNPKPYRWSTREQITMGTGR